MVRDRALVFQGLIPLTASHLDAILGVRDRHLELASQQCQFDPSRVARGQDTAGLTTTVHEALLAVAVIRTVEREEDRWAAYGGLSAGCLPALLAAGVITEAGCFQLIWEINSRQIAANRSIRSGSTLAVLASSEGDARQLVEAARMVDDEPWLSVDLGGGLVALSIRSAHTEPIRALLTRLGVVILDTAERAEHCPYAVPGPEEWERLLGEVDFRSGAAVVISPITGKPVESTPAAYRRMLTEQWFDTASLPLLVDGLCGVEQVRGVDLAGPANSVYATRMRRLLADRAEYRLLDIPG